MVSIDDEKGHQEGEIGESKHDRISNSKPLQILTNQKELLHIETPATPSCGSITPPSRGKVNDSKSLSSSKFQRFLEGRDELSRSVGDSNSSRGHDLRDRFSGPFARKIDWGSLKTLCIEWFKDPINIALFIWILCVAISGAILFLVMTGMLNHVLHKKSQRDMWFEINNQILNALFTLMCLYQHPKRIYHFILLCRWKLDDIIRLRHIYCKNGTYKPKEWVHILVVNLLLNLNCFAQYALCSLNLGYKRSNRPAIGVAICISFAIGAPAVAGVYSMLSPLGKDYDAETDEESQAMVTSGSALRFKSVQTRYRFASKDQEGVLEDTPQWRGGILDFWDDISLAYLSLFCSFCVFGWNMERLGFGNMLVHIATFLLFCMAPFWIFNLAALNIDNEGVREALGITGIVLCVFGLLYGGFWRIQMRKRFKLPGSNICCGEPIVTDFALWLCCCWCSLAQEVRTVNFYDIVKDRVLKEMGVDNRFPITPLYDKFSSGQITPRDNIASPNRLLTKGADQIMTPPVSLSIRRDSDQQPPI